MAPRRRGTTKRPSAERLARRTSRARHLSSPRLRLHNLPHQLTSFVGREREITEVKRLLDTARLVTLTGAGGCGKTRLALRVAADMLDAYPEGVWLAELGSLSDPAFVPKAVASVFDVPEQPSRPMTETLTGYLHTKHALLLLDSCEHLRSACQSLIEMLLRAGAAVRILATSREILGVEGEVTYRVPSLLLPGARQAPAVTQLADYDAIRLFAERAALAQPEFAVTDRTAGPVVEICRRLDGMPLAIELAAARVRMLSIEQIAARLNDRFRLLTGGSRTALPRRETLQATMDWSYSLLTEPERLMWRRLAVFSGGFTLEAAETVCTGGGIRAADILNLLTSLANKSLVIPEIHGDAARYRLLETVRHYGCEKLAGSAEALGVMTRHLHWYLELAERAEPGLWGAEQRQWMDRLEAEHENLCAAMDWSATQGRGPEIALRIAGALWPFWFVRGYWSEGRKRLETGRSREDGTSLAIQAKALIGAGFLAWRQGDYRSAATLGGQSLGLCRTLGDKRGIVLSLHIVAEAARFQGDYVRLASLGAESLEIARELDDKRCIALSLLPLAWDARRQCKYAEAMALYGEGVRLFRELGDKWGTARTLIELGHVALAIDDCRTATAAYEECLSLFRELGHKVGIANTLTALGRVAVRQENYERAAALSQEGLALALELADNHTIARSQTILGDAARGRGAYEEAVRLYKDSLALHQQHRATAEIPLLLERLAAMSSRRKQPHAAARLYGAAVALRDAIGAPLPAPQPAVQQSLSMRREQIPTSVTGIFARVNYERDVAAVRRALGDEAFAAAWADGRAMTLEQIIECALALPNEAAADVASKARDRAAHGAGPLAPREREVAVLVAEGLSNHEIADRLTISERTAETHVQHILNKLCCKSRAQIATWATQRGLVPERSTSTGRPWGGPP